MESHPLEEFTIKDLFSVTVCGINNIPPMTGFLLQGEEALRNSIILMEEWNL
jgi:hypothetical protein